MADGPLPDQDASEEEIDRQIDQLEAIAAPVTRKEAKAWGGVGSFVPRRGTFDPYRLASFFDTVGDDSCFHHRKSEEGTSWLFITRTGFGNGTRLPLWPTSPVISPGAAGSRLLQPGWWQGRG
ncbi:hypothetical protein ACWEQ2_00195 [Streptomyces sp. NPDC004096]